MKSVEFSIIMKCYRCVVTLAIGLFGMLFKQQCREGQDVLPEQIKAVLLDSAGFHGVM